MRRLRRHNLLIRRHTRMVALATSVAIGAAATIAIVVPSAGVGASAQADPMRYQPTGDHLTKAASPAVLRGIETAPSVAPPPALLSAVASLAGHGLGTLETSSTRALISGLPVGDGTLYGVPSSSGALCVFLTADGGPQGCATTFSQHAPLFYAMWDPDGIGAGDPTALVGITGDDVSSLRIQSSDGAAAAPLSSHDAFFYREPAGSPAYPVSIQIIYGDGTSLTFPIPPPHVGP